MNLTTKSWWVLVLVVGAMVVFCWVRGVIA